MASTTQAPRIKRTDPGRFQPGGGYAPARVVLADQRKAGVPFDTAWPLAIQAVKAADRGILRATSEAWRLEYEGKRSWGGDLLAALAAMLDHDAGHRGDQEVIA
jgi:hypothetical protein